MYFCLLVYVLLLQFYDLISFLCASIFNERERGEESERERERENDTAIVGGGQ